MARIRTIKPEFFRNFRLFCAERETGLPLRLAFAGLWTTCDREGRFRWKPEELKLDCLPHDPIDFDAVLEALSRYGYIEQYESEGRLYGWVPGFVRHQRPNRREALSDIPAPVRTATHVQEHATHVQEHPIAVPARGEVEVEVEVEGKGREVLPISLPSEGFSLLKPPKRTRKASTRAANPEYTPEFERVWTIYPNHNAKREALKRWDTLKLPLHELHTDEMVEAIQAQITYKKACDAQGTFCAEFPFLQKWLRGARWEYKPGSPPPLPLTPRQRAEVESNRRLDEHYGLKENGGTDAEHHPGDDSP